MDSNEVKGRKLLGLAVGAIGVVYGDIGTSPLYALKECFSGPHAFELTQTNILGILSLFVWSLVFVVIVKYIFNVMKIDNHGEGGITALLALVSVLRPPNHWVGLKRWLVLLALLGTSLLYADGIITPGISVMGAVEGLSYVTPGFETFVLPITVFILTILFMFQKYGTKRIGAVFGPITLVWFLSIFIAGLLGIIREPLVLLALSPHYAVLFAIENGFAAALVLGAVTLCFTGAEALYADMGHFGRKPIAMAWYWVVFPALVINYLGQGAVLLSEGQSAKANPFYALANEFWVYPLMAVATMAAIVASQALISGAFSLTAQAVELGFLPRLTILHTASETEGQIYVPKVNLLLLISCIGVVLYFKSSSAIAAAYGIAVTGTMVVTTVLYFAVVWLGRGWSLRKSIIIILPFLLFDLVFFSANLVKIHDGGWIPCAISAFLFLVMTTWKKGRKITAVHSTNNSIPFNELFQTQTWKSALRIKGTAVFMSPSLSVAPGVLMHHLKHNKVLHERIVFLSMQTEHIPEVAVTERVRVTEIQSGIFTVSARHGYMQRPNVPEIMLKCLSAGLPEPQSEESRKITYFIGKDTLLTTGASKMTKIRKLLFAFLFRNARPATAYYGIPRELVFEIGSQTAL